MKNFHEPAMPAENASQEEWDAYAEEQIAYENRFRTDFYLPFIMIGGGLIGLWAALKLTLGKITYWQNMANGESTLLGCDINPIVGCGTALNSAQGSIFGSIPNPVIGLVGWSMLVLMGVLLASGVKLKEWHWIGLQAGVLFGLAIVSYLQYQSIYNLYVLCPWCMATWAVMIPTFWIVTANNLRRWFYGSTLAKLVYNWYGLFIFVHFATICLMAWLKFGDAIFK